MTITVAKLKRALVELSNEPEHGAMDAFLVLSRNPTALTMIAEKLSERPLVVEAGLWKPIGDDSVRQTHQDAKLGHAPSYIERKACPTALGDACREGQRCCQRNPDLFAVRRQANYSR